MLATVWSTKGGAGCSVVAALLALQRAHAGSPVLLIDLFDDLATVLGCAPPDGPTLADLVRLGVELTPDAIDELVVEVSPGIRLLGAGTPVGSVDEAIAPLDTPDRSVVVDAGNLLRAVSDLGGAFARLSTHSLLVTRPCYLSLRRGDALPAEPTGVVLVDEPGRALNAQRVEQALGASVVATIAADPALARAVDAGLLASRLPRGLDRALAAVT